MTKLYDQCAKPWGPTLLGYGGKPGTVCELGCYDDVSSIIANDSGHPMDPGSINKLYVAKKIFVRDPTGTYDFLPDNPLDLIFPGEYQTTRYAGLRLDIVKAAIPARDTYVYYHLAGAYSPLWRMVVQTHFVLGWSADGRYIGDPQGGVVRPLSDYGGAPAVQATYLVRRLRPAPVVVVPPAPAPAPTYSIVSQGFEVAKGLTYDAAVSESNGMAQQHIGTLYEILDPKGQTVGAAYFVPAPGPVKPITVPQPSVAPAHVAPDFWGQLQSLIIQVALDIRRIEHK